MSGFIFSKRNKRSVLLIVTIFAALAFFTAVPRQADAAIQIYYSAGQNTSDHKQGTPTVTISGSTAIFSVEQNATNTGIGDKITFGGSSVFITGRISSTTWSVETATGTTPAATSSATVTSITHSFASLKGAIGTGFANNATSTNYLNTSDLVAGNYQLNIPLYYDTGPDTTAVIIAGFTTDATHYLRIYTPTSTNEVNYSQRHGGRWTATAWRMDSNFSFSQPILSKQPYVRYDGLQLRNTTSSGVAYVIDNEVAGNTDDMYLSHSILATTGDKWTCVKLGLGGASYSVHIWNNVFTNCATGIYAGINVYGTSHLYNNTFYDTVIGTTLSGSGTASFKVINNLVSSSTYPFSPTGKALAGSDYNSVNASTTGLSVVGGAGGHDRVNQTPSFVDAANIDFHLLSSDTSGLDVGTSLLGDSALPVADDIDSGARPYNSVFDIGADEYDGTTGDVTPPNVLTTSPSGSLATSTTSTTMTVTTGENATCKYDTSAGTAYASMANTFTTTGGTTHSVNITGLSSGHSYSYYVRCQDAVGNASTTDAVVAFGVKTNGTAYPSTCAASDVNTAIALAIPGDTVQLPSCNVTSQWGTTTATVTVNKQVTLQGNGTSSTSILAGPGTALLISASQVVVRNFTMRIATTTTPIFVSVGGSVDRWRMTGMLLDQEGVPLSSSGANYLVYISNQMTTSNTYGLIDNNRFDGVVGEVFFWRGPCNSWDIANSYGLANALFVEGNTFVSTSTAYIDTNANGRLVARYNDLTKVYFDGHGMNTNTDQCTPERHAGVRTQEIYNNRFISPGFTSVYARGGSGLIYNNTVESTTTNLFGAMWMSQLELTNPGTGLSFYYPTIGYPCKTDYPIMYQIGRGLNSVASPTTGSQQGVEPMFLWNNTYAPYGGAVNVGYGYSGGAASATVRAACGDPTLQVSDVVVQDRDFCTHDTSTTCNGFDLTSYSAYACPHPLAGASGSCNTAVAGTAGYNVAGLVVKPTVTSAAAVPGTTTAALNGSIVATGGADATQSGFAWGTASSLSGGDTATTTLGAQTGAVSLASPISSLSCNTTYYFKPYATNSAGTSHGLVTSFTTKACASALSTGNADSLSATAATLHASISNTGGANAEDSGFAYGTDSALQSGVSTTTEGAQSGTASFAHALSGLTCGTTYYARAYVRTVAGDSFGMIKSLTTSACPVTPPPQTGGGGGGGVSMLGSGPSTFTSPIYAPGYAPASVPKTTGAKPAGGFSLVVTSAGLGSSGVHVKSIQTMLNYAGFTVATAGAGSPGKETLYFGPLTRRAVQAFQLYHQIAKPGDPGFGYVGPKTKAKLNALVGAH